MAPEADLQIVSLRGGMNDEDPPHAIADDQCVTALNVEWFFSTFGERRAGCDPLDMTSSGLTTQSTIVHLSQWYPTNDITSPELWAVGATPGNSGVVPTVARRSGSGSGTPTWFPVVPVHAIVDSVPDIYGIRSQPLNGKLFFAYNSLADSNGHFRLNVWDGSGLRAAGLTQANAPPSVGGIVDEGAGGYTGDRFFRIRYIAKDINAKIIRRSEPSVWNRSTPSGTGAGFTITRGNLLGEGETHWELEASLDQATWYRIQTLAAATLTTTDETAFGAGYASQGPLSEAVGAYLLPPAAKFLASDGDRLLMGGHFNDTTQQSTVSWTPVFNDPGVSNDERLPIVDTGGTNINNTNILDNGAGGPVTGISNAINGTWYAFKYSRVYKAVRTGDQIRAYDIKQLSDTRGAIPGSVVNGVDENGAACVYFLDPVFGPSRISQAGLHIIKGQRTTWKRVNLKASLVACGVFYPYKQQVHWWIAVDGNNTPTLKLVLQASETGLLDIGGAGRGWSQADGRIAQANCVGLYTEWVNDGGSVTLSTRPFIGLTSPDFIQRTDVDTTDAGQAFAASIVTKPYILGGLLNKWGAMVASLLATANASATIFIRLIRDFGVETTAPISVSLAAVGSETFVIKNMDNLVMSEAFAVQVKISDS